MKKGCQNMPILITTGALHTSIWLVENQPGSLLMDTRKHTPRSLSENREPTAEKPFWPFSPLIFVKYNQYSPQISE
jgi:hypothetical protein